MSLASTVEFGPPGIPTSADDGGSRGGSMSHIWAAIPVYDWDGSGTSQSYIIYVFPIYGWGTQIWDIRNATVSGEFGDRSRRGRRHGPAAGVEIDATARSRMHHGNVQHFTSAGLSVVVRVMMSHRHT